MRIVGVPGRNTFSRWLNYEIGPSFKIILQKFTRWMHLVLDWTVKLTTDIQETLTDITTIDITDNLQPSSPIFAIKYERRPWTMQHQNQSDSLISRRNYPFRFTAVGFLKSPLTYPGSCPLRLKRSRSMCHRRKAYVSGTCIRLCVRRYPSQLLYRHVNYGRQICLDSLMSTAWFACGWPWDRTAREVIRRKVLENSTQTFKWTIRMKLIRKQYII